MPHILTLLTGLEIGTFKISVTTLLDITTHYYKSNRRSNYGNQHLQSQVQMIQQNNDSWHHIGKVNNDSSPKTYHCWSWKCQTGRLNPNVNIKTVCLLWNQNGGLLFYWPLTVQQWNLTGFAWLLTVQQWNLTGSAWLLNSSAVKPNRICLALKQFSSET